MILKSPWFIPKFRSVHLRFYRFIIKLLNTTKKINLGFISALSSTLPVRTQIKPTRHFYCHNIPIFFKYCTVSSQISAVYTLQISYYIIIPQIDRVHSVIVMCILYELKKWSVQYEKDTRGMNYKLLYKPNANLNINTNGFSCTCNYKVESQCSLQL
jgi:hypothetical protein